MEKLVATMAKTARVDFYSALFVRLFAANLST
jgi:hypothetical protein